MQLAVPRAYFCDVLDDEVRARFEATLDALRKAGATVVDVNIAHTSAISSVYLPISFGDAAAYHAATLDTMPERYTTPVRQRLEVARYILAEDYVRALSGRDALRREVDAALLGHDALVLPTLPIPAPPIGASSMQVGPSQQPVREMMLRLTRLFNLTGHPAVSLPCGATKAGLPVGLQLVGVHMQTDALMHIALAVEQAI